MIAVAVVSAALLSAQDPVAGPAPAFVVANPGAFDRREVVSASVPLPRGAVRCEAGAVLRMRATVGAEPNLELPALPLMRWPDGSVSVVQVHARVAVPARGRTRIRLHLEEVSVLEDPAGPDAEFPVPAPLPLHTEVEDPWGRVYVARLEPDPTAGPNGLLAETPLVRIHRFRSMHRRVDGDETFLGLRGYLVTFAGEHRGLLTLVLDNGELPCGDLGPVRLRAFRLVTEDQRLRFRPRLPRENGLREPEAREGGGFRQDLLGPADGLYLGDQTAKAFRFDLFWSGDDLDPEALERARAATLPLQPLPELAWVRATGAFGAHGGPAPAAENEALAVGPLLDEWRTRARFGPFGGFGDPQDAAEQGSARAGPSALHNVLRWRSPELLAVAEGMVLQHTLRPTPGRRPALPTDTAAFRQGLGPLARSFPHGFTPLDYEHFSVNLLFDWYWLTGDPLARDELARMGRGLRDVLVHLPFRTSRGEGWCMQSGALIARATGDSGLATWLGRRFREEVLPDLGGAETGHALAQPPHPDAMGREPFDAPWQMAALVHGLHALSRQNGDGVLAAAAVEVAESMAGPGWVDDEGPKYFVSALDPSRYTMPVGYEPRAGTAWMQVGAFVLAAELTEDPELKRLFEEREDFLLEPLLHADLRPTEKERALGNPWLQIPFDRRGRLP